MKRLALVLALLAAAPAVANDNVTVIFWGTTAEAGACQFATLAAAVANGACTRTQVDTTNQHLGQLAAAFQGPCTAAQGSACSVPQLVSFAAGWMKQQLIQYMQSHYNDAATQAATVPVPLN